MARVHRRKKPKKSEELEEVPVVVVDSEYEVERKQNIERNQEFLARLGIADVQKALQKEQPKRKREVAQKKTTNDETSTARLGVRLKTPVVSFANLSVEIRVHEHCNRCSWKSSFSFQSVATAALLAHQESDMCKMIFVEKDLPSKKKTFQTDRKAAWRQKSQDIALRLRQHNHTYVEVRCPVESCNFRASVKNTTKDRAVCLNSHHWQRHRKEMTMPVLAEIGGEGDHRNAGAGRMDGVDDDGAGASGLGEDDDEDNVCGGHVEQEKHHCDPDTTPDETIWAYQQEMLAELNRPRKLRKGKSKEIMIHLFEFGTHLNLTEINGDMLLATTGKILKVLGHNQLLTHKRWRDLVISCRGKSRTISRVKQLSIPLGTKYFPVHENGKDGKLTNATKCYCANILFRIGDALMQLKSSDVQKEPKLLKDASGQRLYGPFTSADKFERYCSFVKTKMNADGSFPLMIMGYFDGAQCSATHNACPLFFSILNAIGRPFAPHLLGYCPLELSYSSTMLRELCRLKFGKVTQENLDIVCNLALRRALDSFLYNAFKPILDFRECGLKVQIGSGKDATIERVFIFMSHTCGDSAEQHKIACVPVKSDECCRLCTNFGSRTSGKCVGEPRDPVKMEKMKKELEEAFLSKISKNFETKTKGKMSALQPANPVDKRKEEGIALQEEETEAAKAYGVVMGTTLVPLLYNNDPPELKSSFPAASTPYDLLHTGGKGPASESPLSWGLQIIHGISKPKLSKQFPEHINAARRLDENIINFPSKHTLPMFTKWWHFSGGITKYLKSGSKKGGKQTRGSGMLAGELATWQLPIMMVQVLFVVADEGINLLPNFKCIKTTHGVHYNPTKVLVETMTSCLQAFFLIRAKTANEKHLKAELDAIRRANFNLDQLFDLKQTLARLSKTKKTKGKTSKAKITNTLISEQHGTQENKRDIKRSKKNARDPNKQETSSAMKMHAWTHFPTQALEFGQNPIATDTEKGEREMREHAQISWSRCSKLKQSAEREMLQRGLAKSFAKMLVKTQCPDNLTENPFCDVDVESDEESDEGGTANSKETRKTEDEGRQGMRKLFTFKVVANMGTMEMRFLGRGTRIEQTSPSTPMTFCHPLLTNQEISDLLCAMKSKKRSCPIFKNWFDNFFEVERSTTTTSSLHLVGGLKTKGCEYDEVDPYHIRARTSAVGSRDTTGVNATRSAPEHTFSFVEVICDGDNFTTFVKVFAILSCKILSHEKETKHIGSKHKVSKLKTDNELLFLVVARLEKKTKIKKQRMLPFNKYGFVVSSNDRLTLELMPLTSVWRPAFMITATLKNIHIEETKDMRSASWFCIPFRQSNPTYHAHQRMREGSCGGEDDDVEDEEEEAAARGGGRKQIVEEEEEDEDKEEDADAGGSGGGGGEDEEEGGGLEEEQEKQEEEEEEEEEEDQFEDSDGGDTEEDDENGGGGGGEEEDDDDDDNDDDDDDDDDDEEEEVEEKEEEEEEEEEE